MADAAAKQKEEKKKRAAAARDNTKILAAGAEVQRDEASKALLREFMHSKKLTSTLATFDAEQPRGELTIQSRALVAQILAAEEWAKANKASAAPLRTLLEVVCSHRLQKTEAQKELTTSNPSEALDDSDDEGYLASALRSRVERRDVLREEIEKKREELEKTAKKVETLTAKRDKKEKAFKKASKGSKKKDKDAKEKGGNTSDDGGGAKKKKKKKKDKDDGKKKKKKMMSFDELLAAGEQKTKQTKAGGHAEGGDGAQDWSEFATRKEADEDAGGEAERAYRDEVRRAAGLSSPDAADTPPAPRKKAGWDAVDGSASTEDGDDSTASSSDSDGSGSDESFGQQVRNAAKQAKKEEEARKESAAARSAAQGRNMNWDIDEIPDMDDGIGEAHPSQPAQSNNVMDMGGGMGMGMGMGMSGGGMGGMGRPIDVGAAQRLRQLLVGSAHFPESWCNQGFYYSDQVAYGLVQNNGGPCGVVAVVQARVAQSLFLDQKIQPSGPVTDPSSIPHTAKETALVSALADTLAAAASGGGVSLALPPELSERPRMTVDFDGWRVQSLGRDKHAIRTAIREHLEFFKARRGLGLLALVVSCIYTKGGMDAVKGDMDEIPGSEGSLIVCHQYTSQELVSLMLFGHACTNVFNGTKDLGMLLRGVPRQSEIGLLTYQEYTRDIEVGSYLKDPAVPVWTIWNESHYTVCFAKEPLGAKDAVVELYYYDPLGCQDEEYHLTLDTTKQVPERGVNDLIPYMDDILRTRAQWTGATVDWNGSEGLL